ncbi:MAG TPA: SHOCT domain-containing protein [Niabella sp.]|nr:SHOCT domain-containing protein [Candidatus Woesebacteria bacterium]HUN03727.1 SHOCT domain-containing protein [Niabella sp.]
MKRIIIFLLIPVLFGILGINIHVFAASDKTVEGVLSEIKTSQQISDINNVNCSKVNNDQLEELGDAVMGIMFPNSEEHELMDNMMGGEGSDSLQAQHIYMGSNYLGCFNGEKYSKNFSMMGRMSMMNGLYDNSLNYYSNPMANMMGSFYGTNSIFSWLVMGFVLILGTLLAIVGFKALLGGNSTTAGKNDSPLEILQRRYASGEIKKEEYEEKLKALK